MQLLILCLLPAAVFVLWFLTAARVATTFPVLRNKRVCLLIAHPDDEAMFFSPTLLALTNPSLGNHVKILCLSSGDADGLGHVRKHELVKSARHLGLRHESDVFVIDDPTTLPDSMTTMWPSAAIAEILASAFVPAGADNNETGEPLSTIDVLVTFDRHGISSHANHRSLYHGAVAFLNGLMANKHGWACPVRLYTLSTVNIARKYVGVLDAPLTMLKAWWCGLDVPSRLVFVNGLPEYRTAQLAMTSAHKSQMIWFRWGWITLSRYMVVNDLVEEKVQVVQ